MAKKYKIGLVIEGDGKGGVKAIKATDDALGKLNKQTKQTAKESKTLKSSFSGVATKAGAVGAAIAGATAIAGSLAALLRTDVIKELKATSDAFGVSVESLSSWSYAARSVGLETDKIGDIFKDTSDKIGDFIATGGGEAKDLFDNLNLSLDELRGLKPDEQLLAIADGLDQVGTNGEKIFYLESLADEASRLLPLLADGAKGLRELQREAEILGVTLDDVDAAMVNEAARSFQTLGGAAEGFANQLTIQLSAAFDGMSDDIINVVDDWGGMEEAVGDLVDGTVRGVAFIMDSLHAFQITLKTVEQGWEILGGTAAEFLSGLEDGIATVINYTLQPFIYAIGEIGQVVAAVASGFGEFLGETGEGLQDLGDRIFETTQELRDFKVGGDDVKGVLDTMKGAADETGRELDEMRNSTPGDDFVKDFKNAQEETRKQAEEAVELKKATEEATEATDKASTAIETQTGKLEEVSKATKEQTEESNVYADAWEKAVERIDEAFANGWLDLIEGNATNVFDSILSGFKQMLAEMAHQAITKPIMLNIQQAFGMGGGSGGGIGSLFGGGGAGGGSGGGFFSNVSSFFGGNSVGQGFADFGGYLGSEFGLYTNQYGGTLFNNAAGSSNLAYGAAGALGGLFGSTAGNNGGIGGSLGATIGMAAAGPIGAAIGAVLGGAAGSLFGGSWESYENGIDLSYDYSDGLYVQNYVKKKKDRGLWRGNDYKTEYDYNDELTKGLDAIMSGVVYDIETAADRLDIDSITRVRSTLENEDPNDLFGGDPNAEARFKALLKETEVSYQVGLSEFLENYSFSAQLDLSGLEEEEALTKVNDYLLGQADSLVETVFGDTITEFQNEGELLVDTLGRVMAQLNLVDQGFTSINLSLEQLAASAGVSELAFSDDLVQEAGGTDRLTALMQGYQANFFTEEELLTRTLEDVAAQVKGVLGDLGLSYGDDFRAAFEAASSQGLAAGEIVDWLEAGNLIGQFEQIGERLAELTETSLSDVLDPVINDVEALSAEQRASQEEAQAAKISDPIVTEVTALNDTVNQQIGTSNDHLDTVSGKLETVNHTLSENLATINRNYVDMRAYTDDVRKQLERNSERTEASIASLSRELNRTNKEFARVVSRSNIAPPQRTNPIISPKPILE
jgi:hypothetical protein